MIFGFKAYLIIQLIIDRRRCAPASGCSTCSINLKASIGNAVRNGITPRPPEGSSFYKLPKILQWFSGNIGFHHIHHLSPRIPNYNLEKCHRSEPLFQTVNRSPFSRA